MGIRPLGTASLADQTKREALLDPDGAFEETYGRVPTVAIERWFKEYGVPYRDYGRDGMAWLREVESVDD